MTHQYQPMRGLWLPLITPFRDDAIDGAALRRLVSHYASLPVDGLILGATTGEGLSLSDDELNQLVHQAAEAVAGAGEAVPLWLGFGGSDTRQLAARLAATADWPIAGYLISSPSYNRPSQDGLLAHFQHLASATARPIMLYNIPYRTGVNMLNETVLRLAETPNIVGIKDCSAVPRQSAELLRQRPSGFSVLTGEDAGFFDALCHGADGAILASAHVETARFARIMRLIDAGGLDMARQEWGQLIDVVRLLFSEPSPSGLKHWLWRTGLIDAADSRLPMLPASATLRDAIDVQLSKGAIAKAG